MSPWGGGTDDPEPARCRLEWRVTGTQPTGQYLEAARQTNENELEELTLGKGVSWIYPPQRS